MVCLEYYDKLLNALTSIDENVKELSKNLSLLIGKGENKVPELKSLDKTDSENSEEAKKEVVKPKEAKKEVAKPKEVKKEVLPPVEVKTQTVQQPPVSTVKPVENSGDVIEKVQKLESVKKLAEEFISSGANPDEQDKNKKQIKQKISDLGQSSLVLLTVPQLDQLSLFLDFHLENVKKKNHSSTVEDL